MWSRFLKCLLMVVVSVVGVGCSVPQPEYHSTDISGANYGRGLKLLDSNGKLRTIDEFKGKVVLLYFGFIQCPDVCPTALSRAVKAKAALGELGDRFQLLFVTVDPERDTPEIVRAYLAAFDDSFIGLIPSMEELPEAAKKFRVFYRKVPTGSSYTMDHTATSFIFDTEGQLKLAAPHALSAKDLADDLKKLLTQPANH